MRIIGKETKMRKNKEKGTKNKEMQDLRINNASNYQLPGGRCYGTGVAHK